MELHENGRRFGNIVIRIHQAFVRKNKSRNQFVTIVRKSFGQESDIIAGNFIMRTGKVIAKAKFDRCVTRSKERVDNRLMFIQAAGCVFSKVFRQCAKKPFNRGGRRSGVRLIFTSGHEPTSIGTLADAFFGIVPNSFDHIW